MHHIFNPTMSLHWLIIDMAWDSLSIKQYITLTQFQFRRLYNISSHKHWLNILTKIKNIYVRFCEIDNSVFNFYVREKFFLVSKISTDSNSINSDSDPKKLFHRIEVSVGIIVYLYNNIVSSYITHIAIVLDSMKKIKHNFDLHFICCSWHFV